LSWGSVPARWEVYPTAIGKRNRNTFAVPHGPIMTTQLYFPNEPANAHDGIFDPALIVNLQTTSTGQAATFNFVITVK
jgi:hypothetical protein